MRRFYATWIGADSLCFDIGAHVGNRLRAWSALGATVVAVEPQPRLVALLERWFGRRAGITLIAAAVGAQPGHAMLHLPAANPTVATLSTAWMARVAQTDGFDNIDWRAAAHVSVTTLDALIAAHGLPDFCKIDVEGFEAEVLRGLSQPLPLLSFEHTPATFEIGAQCIERLGELGDYCYNWSLGETHRLAFDQWLSPAAMCDHLHALAVDSPSGDVYARLNRNGRGTMHSGSHGS